MAVSEARAPRTYGGWRRPTTPGLGSLGKWGTIAAVAALIIGIILGVTAGMITAGVWALLVTLTLVALTVRDRDHRTTAQKTSARVSHRQARRSGTNLYRSGPLGQVPWGTHQLPGLAAASKLTEHRDSYDRPFALLEYPSTGDFVVVLSTEPDGAALVDEAQVDMWVARWGVYLASLGDEPGLLAAAVTVESAPDSGHRLRQEVESHTDPDAPQLAREALAEIVTTYPSGGATVRAWVTFTFSGTDEEDGKRTPADMGRDLASRIPNLAQELHATGAGAARPMGAQELCEVIRVAFDPAAAQLFDAARACGDTPELDWSDVGPSFHEHHLDHYLHEDAASITWAASALPSGAVQSSILARMLGPDARVDRKRVTFLYQVKDSGTTAKTVEDDLNAARFRVTAAKGHPSERALADLAAAQRAANAEASGAGLADLGIVVTATVLGGRKRVKVARGAIRNLSSAAKTRLRVVRGSQDSAFLAGLPLGLVLPRHITVPTALRENL